MPKRSTKLLDEIEGAATDGSASVADALRKCVILGGRAGSTELREWATRELKGYESREDVPEYRRVGAIIKIDGFTGNRFVGVAQITGQQISPGQLPDPVNKHVSEEIALTGGIGEIEEYVTQAHARGGALQMALPQAGDVVRLMNYEIQQRGAAQEVSRVYWDVNEAALAGVVDGVRTVLAELVGEIRAGLPDHVEIPSAELATQAVNVAVNGDRSRVTVAAPQVSGRGNHTVNVNPSQPLWRQLLGPVISLGAKIFRHGL